MAAHRLGAPWMLHRLRVPGRSTASSPAAAPRWALRYTGCGRQYADTGSTGCTRGCRTCRLAGCLFCLAGAVLIF
eukprot:1416733-Alexandrium_andersonii.AAC.1